MFDLTGKTALITGASRGIGKAIAIAIHQAGAEVILSASNQEKLNQCVTELGNKASAITTDLTNNNAIDELAKQAQHADILINNAGLTQDQLCMRMNDDEWNKVMQVDLQAPFRLSKNILRAMMKRKYGRIINISSIVGSTGNPGQSNYSAAKGALEAMSKSMAREVATRGITVNCIAPGFIASDMTAELNEQIIQNLKQQIPMQKIGSGEDIAATCVFLASQEASYITGQTIHVNGGMLMP